MNVVILCSGTILDYSFYNKYIDNADLILCADGGANHLKKMGYIPDILVGDFDSINKKDLQYYIEKEVEIVKFPPQKDMTDTESAIDIAISKGAKIITLLGAQGTRLDHTLANIFLLKYMLGKGVVGKLINEHNEICIINDEIALEKKENYKVSLIPISDRVEGITTYDLLYPLNNATIELGSPLGISNEFTSDAARVTIKRGLLLVLLSKD